MAQPHVPTPREPDGPHQPIPRRRVVVCGDDPLAHRLVGELVNRYPVEVTVVFASSRRGHAARIAAIEGVRVVESDQLDKPTLLAAGVAEADALAIVAQDDAGNIHAALRAQELNPSLRLVIRMFNMRLGHGVRAMFRDCAVLSDASMAAPTFVAAALGEIAPTHIRVAGRTLFVARRTDVAPNQILCGLADTSNAAGGPVLLPADQSRATMVLATTGGGRGAARAHRAHGDDQPDEPVAENQVRRGAWRQLRSRIKRSPYVVLAMARALISRRLWRGVLALIVLLLSGSAIVSAGHHLNPWQAVYVTVLTALGNGQTDVGSAAYLQVANLIVVVAGVALIPFITAAVVETVVTTRWDSFRALGYARHVIVIGLGNVGTRVIQQLHDIGLPVVAIDRRGDSRGAQVTRQLGIPFIIGDAGREETLRAANVQTCRAVVALSTDDVVNLEAGLHARNLNPGVRVVLRLFDGEFAELVQQSFGITSSRSVSSVAAPAFAAAIFEREVIGTIPVQRRVLLIAEVPVGTASTLDGGTVADADDAEQVRVLALTLDGTGWRDMVWSPAGSIRLGAGDRILLIATRQGLSQILAATTADPARVAGS
ncbi:MAG: NAD-binding protein [Micromonosporaceae bacterium]